MEQEDQKVTRDNEILDEVLASNFETKKARRRRKPGIATDHVRRLAFRVLAMLAEHDGPTRRRVLAKALKLNDA
jgi:hypothetical protein